MLAYLTALGLYLFYRGVMHRHTERRPKVVAPLGLVGGFLDAAGGGGWGGDRHVEPAGAGQQPAQDDRHRQHRRIFPDRHDLGDIPATLGWKAFTFATLGLLIGGVLAAPFGAWIAKRVNPDTLLTFVGALLTADSLSASIARLPDSCERGGPGKARP